MPNNDNITGYEHVAQTTIELLEYSKTPDLLSDAILEKLIEMSHETRINIWHAETGINLQTLAALYSMYETGAGHHRMRLYGEYEAGRVHRRRLKIDRLPSKGERLKGSIRRPFWFANRKPLVVL
jgi:hypothetical protein